MKTFLYIIFGIIFFSLFILCLPILAYKNNISIDNIIAISKIIISWQMVVIILFFVFIKKFESEIKNFFKEGWSMKLPGPIEISTQQTSEANNIDNKVIESNTNRQENIDSLISILEDQSIKHSEQRDRLEKLYAEKYNESLTWKFYFLNLFFVAGTKTILSWFRNCYNLTAITDEIYNNSWKSYITDSEQRSIILSVLLQHNMIERIDNKIQITDEGVSFLNFIRYPE